MQLARAEQHPRPHLPALLSDHGLSPGQSAAALSVMGLASICGRLATGWLVDRFFAARVSFVLLLLAAGGAFLLSNAESFAAVRSPLS